MLDELGLGDGRLLFSHFNIPCTSLDDGLVSLMADEDVVKLLEYMPMFREFDVYVEEVVLVIEQHMIEVSVIVSLSQDDMNMPWGMVARYMNDDAIISELEADEVHLKLKDEEPSEVDMEVEDEREIGEREVDDQLFLGDQVDNEMTKHDAIHNSCSNVHIGRPMKIKRVEYNETDSRYAPTENPMKRRKLNKDDKYAMDFVDAVEEERNANHGLKMATLFWCIFSSVDQVILFYKIM
ncbi:hypothetical protein Tco_0620775 [Tanacetum coccineum]